jgi:hypothetical protein
VERGIGGGLMRGSGGLSEAVCCFYEFMTMGLDLVWGSFLGLGNMRNNRNRCGIGFGSRYGVCDIGLGAPLS